MPIQRFTRITVAWQSAALLCALSCACFAADSAKNLPVPTPQQLAWHEAEVGLFFHWAPNVYQGGEGDNLSTPRDKINPDRFDAAQWVQAVKAANAGYMIFVAKHIGGYCAWQTKTTDYSLKTSPWKQGQGDMLAELAKACQARDVRLGVYLSPRDDTHGIGSGGHARSPEKQAAYNEIYRQQLTEILTGYGPMFEMWFDGGNIVPINDVIDKLSPGIISFQGRRTGGSRWVGTEHGFAPYPCWNTIAWKEGETPKEGAGTPTGNLWCPAECDVSIIRPRWFWSPGCDRSILRLEALIEIYYMSVGHGVNLLLNATPDAHGEVPAAQMKRLQEFGDEVRERFAKPLFATKGEGNNLSLDFGGEKTIDHIVLREDLRGGERVRKFLVEGQRANGKWLALARGTQVGNRQIIPIPATAVTSLRLTVQESVAPVTIRELSVFHVNRPVPKLAYREGGRPLMRAPSISRSRDGNFAIDCPTPDWEIRYTLDGSEPTRQSPVYREPQSLPLGGVLKARYFETEEPTTAGGPVAMRQFGLPPSQIKVVRASSDEKDTPPTAAFDGDPKTMWHTAWRKGAALPPHEIVIDLGKAWPIAGIGYLARQDAVGNFPKGIRVWASDAADGFTEKPQFEGDFGSFKTNPHAWHQVDFPQPIRGRYVRIVYPGEVNNTKCVASAEIEILVGKTGNEGASNPAPSLIPMPARLELKEGAFELNSQTVVSIGQGAGAEAAKLAARLTAATGMKLPTGEAKRNLIWLELDRSLKSRLGGEGYSLSITPERVLIQAAAEAGLFYGGITFQQLLPVEAFASSPRQGREGGWRARCVEIEDQPRFAWRGLLLDPSRHFLPPEFIKRFVDLMALHKLNSLQLHLTDDQGWRLEIKKHPRLTQVGSVRKESPKKGDRKAGDGVPYGPFYYTQEQMRELVAYAQSRHVVIVPEIELPGHFLAAVAAYPELSCRGLPAEVRTRWGIEPDILCAGNDAAVAFVKDVLEEVCAVFPSPFIHIGGDEAPRDRWKSCSKCQARLRAQGLKNEAQLQTWLNRQLDEFLVSKGRRMIGWDEILEGGLTPGAAVMSWRGVQGGIAAAEAGHDVVMSPTTHCYFDYAQSREPGEPECIGGLVPLRKVYEFDPLPPQLNASRHRHVLGAQGNLWSEYLWTPQDVEYFAFPRAAALAEVVWSEARPRDFDDFQSRLQMHLRRLDAQGVNYRKGGAAAK